MSRLGINIDHVATLRNARGEDHPNILEIAKMVKEKINCEIIILESNDPRSYRQDSSKLIETGFKPNFGVKHAIDEIISKFHSGDLMESDSCYTVKWMKANDIK